MVADDLSLVLQLPKESILTDLKAGKTAQEIIEKEGKDKKEVQKSLLLLSETKMKTKLEKEVALGTITKERAHEILEKMSKNKEASL